MILSVNGFDPQRGPVALAGVKAGKHVAILVQREARIFVPVDLG
jgi:hypothetical protein